MMGLDYGLMDSYPRAFVALCVNSLTVGYMRGHFNVEQYKMCVASFFREGVAELLFLRRELLFLPGVRSKPIRIGLAGPATERERATRAVMGLTQHFNKLT